MAKIRDGKVEEGRREMEVAASLDPNNSMIRSYLGKAYFEEKRDDMTEREYKNAKELDPKDPTPFFYDALQKQLTNRPVEALQDMETAIGTQQEPRGLSIAVADGFRLGRAQCKPGPNIHRPGVPAGGVGGRMDFHHPGSESYTAARFLADTYASRERHEVARVSELLRSQLLQPTNITPIQPSQAISNRLLIHRVLLVIL